MAKSKEQGRKPKSKKKNKVVQDGGVHKPKEIKTNLKHINITNRIKTEALDSQFNELKQEVIGDGKKKPEKITKIETKVESKTEIKMEETVAEFEKLGAQTQ